MKLVLWFLCLLFAVRGKEQESVDKLLQAFSTRDDESPQLIVDTAECIRQHLIDGIPSLNVPSFNPLQIKTIKPDFSNISHIEGNLILTNLYLNGIPNFYLTDVDFSITILPPRARMEFIINLDQIVLEVNYDGAVTLFSFLELFGNGGIKLEIKNVRIPVSVVQGLINVQDASMTLTVDDLQVNTTGLLRDEYLSGLIGNRLEDIVQTVLSQYSQTIDETLTTTLLSALEGRSALELLALIQGIRNSCNVDENVETNL